jgi:hypothetical protein
VELIHDWYWARGQAGPYSVIASYITAHEKYGYTAIPIFMLARDGVLIGDDPSRLRFEALGSFTDSVTGKPVANLTRYTYTADDHRYVVTFTRHRDLSRNRMVEGLHGVKRVAAELLRFDGAFPDRVLGRVLIDDRGALIVLPAVLRRDPDCCPRAKAASRTVTGSGCCSKSFRASRARRFAASTVGAVPNRWRPISSIAPLSSARRAGSIGRRVHPGPSVVKGPVAHEACDPVSGRRNSRCGGGGPRPSP